MSTPPKTDTNKASKAEKKGYTKGDALKDTVADLSKSTFKVTDHSKWSSIKNNNRASSVSAQGLSSINQKTKLPRYNKK
jgi:hypothetical protein